MNNREGTAPTGNRTRFIFNLIPGPVHINEQNDKRERTAPTGNRTQGNCLEGSYVTTTPLVPLLKENHCLLCSLFDYPTTTNVAFKGDNLFKLVVELKNPTL